MTTGLTGLHRDVGRLGRYVRGRGAAIPGLSRSMGIGFSRGAVCGKITGDFYAY